MIIFCYGGTHEPCLLHQHRYVRIRIGRTICVWRYWPNQVFPNSIITACRDLQVILLQYFSCPANEHYPLTLRCVNVKQSKWEIFKFYQESRIFSNWTGRTLGNSDVRVPMASVPDDPVISWFMWTCSCPCFDPRKGCVGSLCLRAVALLCGVSGVQCVHRNW